MTIYDLSETTMQNSWMSRLSANLNVLYQKSLCDNYGLRTRII